MRPRTAAAFAPAVISNFFAIHDEGLRRKPPDLSLVGATGGGFTLSRGVHTRARVVPGSSREVSVEVNGDPNYPAETTRTAVELLLAHERPLTVELVQTVEVPIGAGFGSSSASALSAVMAVSAALELPLSKEQVASFAHEADIVRRTGLGTVASTYDHSGAAIIVRAGEPGVAEMRKVRVPAGLRVVTASVSHLDKAKLLSSVRTRKKLNTLGDLALERASDLKLESLLAAGQEFARGLGLMTPEVERLVNTALELGAVGASQNMVGNSMHAVVHDRDSEAISSALRSADEGAKIDSFRIGGRAARVLRVTQPDFPHA